MDFILQVSTDVPDAERAELKRALEASAQVSEPPRSKDAAQMEAFMLMLASIQTLGVIYNWIQIARARNPRAQVTIKKPDGTEIVINDMTVEQLQKILDA